MIPSVKTEVIWLETLRPNSRKRNLSGQTVNWDQEDNC